MGFLWKSNGYIFSWNFVGIWIHTLCKSALVWHGFIFLFVSMCSFSLARRSLHKHQVCFKYPKILAWIPEYWYVPAILVDLTVYWCMRLWFETSRYKMSYFIQLTWLLKKYILFSWLGCLIEYVITFWGSKLLTGLWGSTLCFRPSAGTCLVLIEVAQYPLQFEHNSKRFSAENQVFGSNNKFFFNKQRRRI